MVGVKGCMFEFNGDMKFMLEEFVKVFKEFDKDGKNMSVLNIIFYCYCGSWNCVLIIFSVKYMQIIFYFFFWFLGNGYIEVDEFD